MNKTSRIVIGIVEKDGYVLVIRRFVQEGKLLWCFPGGEMESKDVSEQEAVIREVREETNIDCLPVARLGQRKHPDTGKILAYWKCKYQAGKYAIQDPQEIVRILWVSPEKAFELFATDVFLPVRHFLEELSAR